MLQKNRIGSIVLFFVLASSILSIIPTFAQTTELPTEPPVTEPQSESDIIISLLAQSSNQVDEQIQQLESNGMGIPPDVSTIFDEGIVEHQASLDAIEGGDLENGKEHALKALSLFDDAFVELLEVQEGFGKDFFELEESIVESEIKAEDMKDLIVINNLDISLDDYDDAVALAKENLANGDLFGSEQQLDFADDLLDDIFEHLEDKVEEDRDELIKEFVEDTVDDLENIIANANELGVSQTLIDQLKTIVNDLQNVDNPNEILGIADENSDLEEFFSEFPDLEPDEDAESAWQQAASDAESAWQQAASDAESARQQSASDSESARQQAESDEESAIQQAASDAENNVDDYFGDSAVGDEYEDNFEYDVEGEYDDAESARQQSESDAESARQQSESDAESARQQSESDAESARQQEASDAESARQQAESDAGG